MRWALSITTLFGALVVTSCSTEGSSECALFCSSWYECASTARSCDYPGTSADEFRSLCVPKCDDVAGTLTEAERTDTVSCLECMLAQVEPSECTGPTVADAAFGPCETICMQPGPDRFRHEMNGDLQITALCDSIPCADDDDCEAGDFCRPDTGACGSFAFCVEDSDCLPDEFCDYDSCTRRSCSDDTDCRSGETCAFDTCRPA